MKKNVMKLALAILLATGYGAKSQDVMAYQDFRASNDTVKIVHNGDTTLIVNSKKNSLVYDTTVIVSNDSVFLKSQYLDTVLTDKLGNQWEIHGDSYSSIFKDFLQEFSNIYYGNVNNYAENKDKRKKYSVWSHDFDLTLSYGPLSWSSMKSGDDFLSSPDGDYGLKFWSGSRWSMGFYTTFFPNSFLNLHLGLLYQSNVFVFRNNVTWNSTDNKISPFSLNSDSKLVARYIGMPLIMSVNLGEPFGYDFSLDLGAIGGLNFRTSHTGFKSNFDQNDKHIEESTGTHFKNFAPLKLDAHVGLNFSGFQIYFEQAITPLFKDNKEKELYPFSFGIMIGL
ncbi:MAG: hypothetical protein IJ748_00200 [Bacteroidales bacterium]|nr:hypothetical protein [Bacteroidales bacterium]